MVKARLGSDKCARILIVEDDEMQAQIVGDCLVAKGFTVDFVTNGLAAVQRAQIRHYDAVLIDYAIPDLDGLATGRLLHDFLPPLARPILIALTVSPERLAARERGEESVFDLILNKSHNVDEVIFDIAHSLEAVLASPKQSVPMTSTSGNVKRDRIYGPSFLRVRGNKPRQARILIAEDDEVQGALLKAALEARGCFVEITTDGLEAVRIIRRDRHDLVIIDYNLPQIDGLGIACLVHDHMAQAMRPRLIALTANPDLLGGRNVKADMMFDKIVCKSSGLYELQCAVDHLLRFSPNPEARRAVAHLDSIGAEPAAGHDAL